MRARRRDELLRDVSWPALEPVNDLMLAAQDTIVMCAGFEDRSVEVLQRAVASGCRNFKVICADYLPLVAANRREQVASMCSVAGAQLRFVTYDREKPAGAGNDFFSALPVDGIVHVDISGMSRLLIVQLMVEFLRRGHGRRLRVLYVEAHDYPPSRDEFIATEEAAAAPLGLAMFLSSGVFGLTVVPELSSVAMQGQPIRAVIFPSWNAAQIAAICAEIQASFFTVINGCSPRPEHGWRAEAIRRINKIDTLSGCEEITASTIDYRDSLEKLLVTYAAHAQREKILLIPTGSKMQSVAVGIAAAWLSDLQIVYPAPRTFSRPDDYTRGAKNIYSLNLFAFPPVDQSADPESASIPQEQV